MRSIFFLAILLVFSACLISGDILNSSIEENVATVSIPRGADPVPERHASWHLERTWYKKQVPERDESRPWPLLTPRRTEKTVFLRLSRRVETTEENNHVEDDLAEELSVEVSYEDVYDTLVFLAATWVMGQLSMLVGMPSLVGEICAGFLLGPPLADFVPFPEAMVLIGEIGLLMLLLEAGIEVDIAQLKETGIRSVGIAFTGATFSLGVGMVLAIATGEPVKSSFAVGASFAPTSIGVASNALSAGKVLNTPVGQLIIAAGVIDDIIGLVILAMLEVVVKDDAKIYEFFIPIISSVGYLVVLGGSALTWMPKFIENKYLPFFKEKYRDMAAMGLMMALVFAYLPLLFYSKASYLTGAFLAGLTFSQIDSVHATFVQTTHHIMAWLLRIFFAASIGFQVPIKMFGDGKIIGYGFLYYVAVLAKLPLGFFAPKFQDSVPEGFPYNPYKRDVVIVGLAMSCRGEFSFIIAAFALGEKLVNAELYSSIVFAVLLSAITSPFALLTAIKYFNKKSEEFLDDNPLLKDDKELNETIPLYLAIQARTENQWGLQEKFRKSVKKLSLDIIDHRSWHPRGRDAVVVTEMYVQDTLVRIHNPAMYLKSEPAPRDTNEGGEVPAKDDVLASTLYPRHSTEFMGFDAAAEDEAIEKRIEEVRAALVSDLGPDSEAEVLVSQWQPHVFQTGEEQVETTELLLSDEDQDRLKEVLVHLSVEDRNRLLEEVNQELAGTGGSTTDMGGAPSPPAPPAIPEIPSSPRFRRVRTRYRQTSAPVVFAEQTAGENVAGSVRRIRQLSSPSMSFIIGGGSSEMPPPLDRGVSQPLLSHEDLWDIDEKAQDAAQQGVMPPPQQIDLTGGPTFGVGHRRKVKSDLTGLMNAGPTVEERLGGYVRRDLSSDSTRRRPARGLQPPPRPSRRRQTSFPPTGEYPDSDYDMMRENILAAGEQGTPPARAQRIRTRQQSYPPMPTLGENDTAPPTSERVNASIIPESENENE